MSIKWGRSIDGHADWLDVDLCDHQRRSQIMTVQLFLAVFFFLKVWRRKTVMFAFGFVLFKNYSMASSFSKQTRTCCQLGLEVLTRHKVIISSNQLAVPTVPCRVCSKFTDTPTNINRQQKHTNQSVCVCACAHAERLRQSAPAGH